MAYDCEEAEGKPHKRLGECRAAANKAIKAANRIVEREWPRRASSGI